VSSGREQDGRRNDFSGDADTVLQVGDLHGDVNLRTSRVLPVPNQLPIAPSHFVDREEWLEMVLGFIAGDLKRPPESSTKIVAIDGPPGVGKTALALHGAHKYRSNFPDGALYVDMHAYSPDIALESASALEAFIRAFDILPESIPESLGARSALFRSIVNQRRILVIIDNADNSAQVRPLLPACAESMVLITSRNSLSGLAAREGAMRVKLDVLSPGESVQLLSQLVTDGRVEADIDSARRVAELCGYLPLALRLVGERAAIHPGITLGELADEIVSEHHRLDELAEAEDELSDTRAVFSWSYRALPADLRETFRLIGLHAGSEFAVGPIAALLGANVRMASRHLRALANANLVREVDPGRFGIHDLLRLYARELLTDEEPQERRSRALRRQLSWYLLTTDVARKALLPYSTSVELAPADSIEIVDGFSTGKDAMDWFLAERLNILAATRQSMEMAQYDIAWKLAVASSGFFELSSYWVEWKSIQELGLEAATLLGDRVGEMLNSQILGDVSWRSDDFDTARSYYERSAALSHDLGDRWIEAFAFRGIGLTYQGEDRSDFAVPLFEAALQFFREISFPRGEGMTLASLGKCALALGNASRAIEASRQAIVVLNDIEDAWSVAWTRMDLAAGLEQAGEENDAMAELNQAVVVFSRLKDRRMEANARFALGRLYQKVGDTAGARDAWQKARELYENIDHSRAEEVRVLLSQLPDEGGR
jgi:tetratricopeptide (TPR) repeat protein